MLDVTELILEDHERLRRRFAGLDDAPDNEALGVLWDELADLLIVHAECEESVFYPSLLKKGGEESGEETEDAIEDHDKIKDAVREAGQHPVGSDPWWKAVREAGYENSDHLAEEERDVIPDFRQHASDGLRAQLAVAWTKGRRDHQPLQGVDAKDHDPKEYIEANS